MTKPTLADQLVQLVEDFPDVYELFHTPGADPEPFVTIVHEPGVETVRVQSIRFRRQLAQAFYLQHRRVPNTQAVQEALNVLAGRACFEGPAHPVACRIGATNDGWFIDLGADDWRALEIHPGAWRIVDRARVRFRRERGMLALPAPTTGGSVDILCRFINVATFADFALVIVWLLAAMRPTGPYTVLVVHGEQGSCKSTLARVLRRLVDPNDAELRPVPRDERDIAIAARNGWVIALDNMSRLPEWLSDALCRVATGGGFGTRTLFANDEETLMNFTRPIVVNGIEELATRPDLLDRALILTLPTVPDERRQTEEHFWRFFEAAAPAILGALLDVLVRAEDLLPDVHLERSPRMADFAKFGVAVERALNWPSGTFLQAYMGNRGSAHELTLEASPIASIVRDFMAKRSEWSGRAGQLLDDLKTTFTDVAAKDWPKTATVLSGQLRRLAPSLRSVGLNVEFEDKARPRRLVLRQRGTESACETASGASGPSGNGTGRRSDAPDALFPPSTGLGDRPDAA